jgi:hypothetical protein
MKHFISMKNQTIEAVMEKAEEWGLRSEVRAEAMALIKEDPTLDTGSAYIMAARDWDVL